MAEAEEAAAAALETGRCGAGVWWAECGAGGLRVSARRDVAALGPAGLIGVEGFKNRHVPAAEVGGEPVLDEPVDEGVEGESVEALTGHAEDAAVLDRELVLNFRNRGASRGLLDVQLRF